MRVVVPHRLADDLRALPVLGAGGQVQIVHREEDAPLRGLQAVAHIRQRARDDDAHRERHERIAHLQFDVDVRLSQVLAAIWHSVCLRVMVEEAILLRRDYAG